MKQTKKITIITFLVLLVFISADAIAKNKQGGDLRVKDVRFTSNEKTLFRADEIVVKYKNDNKPFRVLKVSQGESVAEAIVRQKKNKDVIYAEPNYIAYADMIPNDPFYSPYQWHFDNAEYGGINIEEAWNTTKGEGAVVAVIDTGLRLGGADTPVCVYPGYDFVNNDNDPSDDEGHGTHVTGTIAQNTNNGIGVAGVAYQSCIMPIKALNALGEGSYTNIANAIYFAVDNGANVINMSLGGYSSDNTLANAVAYADAHGVIVVAAAGNDSTNIPHYPSAYETVISVGATGYDNSLASYSNYGSTVDVVAPGGDMFEYLYNPAGRIKGEIVKDLNGDGYPDGILQETFDDTGFGYFFYQGTSMAAPHVAGVAALLVSMGKTDPKEVRSILESTATDLGTLGRDDIFGYGLINAAAAVETAVVYEDVDGDGFTSNVDCNDSDPFINPNALEVCDLIDSNCDGFDGLDIDNDGFETCGSSSDCIDTDNSVYPGAEELCDGVDNDCNGQIDGMNTITICGLGECVGNVGSQVCDNGIWSEDTCDPFVGAQIEECGDNLDNDCDGVVDEGCVPVAYCGDGMCGGILQGEDCSSCPVDCAGRDHKKFSWCCGDGSCDQTEECAVDCGN